MLRPPFTLGNRLIFPKYMSRKYHALFILYLVREFEFELLSSSLAQLSDAQRSGVQSPDYFRLQDLLGAYCLVQSLTGVFVITILSFHVFPR